MEKKLLQELNITENKIRTALEENNFVEISHLSLTFDKQIKKITNALQIQHDVSKQDMTLLKDLSKKLIRISRGISKP